MIQTIIEDIWPEAAKRAKAGEKVHIFVQGIKIELAPAKNEFGFIAYQYKS